MFWLFKKGNHFFWLPNLPAQEINVTDAYKYAFYIPMPYRGAYGHWFTDALAGLVFLPKWVWDTNPVYICLVDPDRVRFTLSLIDINNVNILSTQDYVFCENLFILTGIEAWHTFGMHTNLILKKKFREKLELDKIEPVNYIFHNKEPGRPRHFTNFDDVVMAAKEATGLEWKTLSTPFSKRVEFAREFASIKILVTPSGSIAFNTIYMKDGMGMISLFADSIDFPQVFFCHTIRIWNIGIIHENIKHFGGPDKGNLEKIIENIKRMLYTIENQHYPPNHGLFDAYNLEESKQIYFQEGENTLIQIKQIKMRLDFIQQVIQRNLFHMVYAHTLLILIGKNMDLVIYQCARHVNIFIFP